MEHIMKKERNTENIKKTKSMKRIKNIRCRIIAIVLSLILVITMADMLRMSARAVSAFDIVSFAKLSDELSNISITKRIPEAQLKAVFPKSLTAYMADGSTRQVSVSWKTAEDYAAEDVYYYVYDPVFSGFKIAEDAKIPYIVVWIEDSMTLNETRAHSVMAPAADEGAGSQGNGDNNTASGDNNTTSGDSNTSGGDNNTTSGDNNTTDGDNNTTDGDNNTSSGDNNTTSGDSDTSSGDNNTSGDNTNITNGDNNESSSDENDSDKNDSTNDDSKKDDSKKDDSSSKKSVIIPTRSNEENTFYYLVEQMGLCEAAAVGVLANIKAESNFNPNAMGDKVGDTYTSYGICQWHNNRWNTLKIFCATMEEDWESLEGQLKYLQYELEHNYKHVLNALKAVDNTPEGAYKAGYVFCAKFEIPANTEVKADYRGRVARDTFWPKYGGYVTENGQTYIWRNVDGKSYWYEDGVRQGTLADAKGVLGDGTVRGREIYDPLSNAWYWLDAAFDGAKAVNKEVWIPYIYNGEENWDSDKIATRASASAGMAKQVEKSVRSHGKSGAGKWVRYDENGKMIKGWYTVDGADAELYPKQVGNTYYYDPLTGLMAKGEVEINGVIYYFNELTGALIQ